MIALAWLAGPAFAAVPADLARDVSMGDCRAVIAALPSPAADDERLVVGHCLLHDGDPAGAAAVLAPVTTGVYGDYARLERAQALADAGKPAEAITAASGLSLPGDAGMGLRLLRDRLLVESDRSLEARDDLRALLDTSSADEARWWLAAGAEKRGDAAAAVPVYRKLWATSTRGPWSDKASDRLTALKAPVPDLATADGRSLVRDRIAALRKDNQNDRAYELLLKLRAVEPATTPDARLQLARTAFDARKYADARDAYRGLLGDAATCDGATSDLFDYALATARSGDYPTATLIYRRLDTLHPTATEADFARFKIGYMAYDAGDAATARTELHAYVAARPTGEHVDEALWFAGRAAWHTGDLAAATTDWDALVAQRPKSPLAPAAAYWNARALGKNGDADGEKAGLERVISAYPTSGHAWYAAQRLGRTFPHHDRVARPAWPASFASRTDVQRGEALLAVGFVREARAELAPVRADAAASRDSALAAAWALIASGDYNGGKALAEPYCVSPWKDGDAVAQQACTPMPEADIVWSTAAKYGLNPLVPFGIMTAESALKPEVTSLAGARGLMQVMPAELPRIHAEVFGAGTSDPDDLYLAPYNAAIGTGELGGKQRSLGDILVGTSIPAVVASYNGGEEAVRRWVAAYPEKPEFDEFAEDVGYTETRQYVRRVLGYVMAYRWVYGDP